ncbi:MAG: uroporphyrinogen-III C-methyltransferase, partial [Planctomycetota bacterium]
MTAGRVYLVGAGPGDPGLITVRGLEVLSEADVIVHDYLAPAELPARARPQAERIYVGKRAGKHTLSQDEINALLVDRARGGATVVRLKGGDPFVFGRGGEEALALAEAHVAFEVVPGVTAAVAAAAYAGIPVTHRGLAGGVALVTGHEAPDKDRTDLDFQALADWPGTLAFYMGVSNLATICRELIAHGLDGDTPAAVVQWGTTPRQQTLTGTVTDLPRLAADADVKPPAIILIGHVVRLRGKLQWFERRRLFGRRIVVTRPRAQAAGLTDRLRRLGADVLELPAIRIEPPDDPKPLEDAAAEAGAFDWILFTSVNGVDAFFAALRRLGADSRALGGVGVGSIGPATTERLGRYGIRPDAQPAEFTSAELARVVASLGDLDGAK